MFFIEVFVQSVGMFVVGGGLVEILFLIVFFFLIFVVMYFFIICLQWIQMKCCEEMLNNVCCGDQVVIGGGIFGKVIKVFEDEKEVEVEIVDGVKICVICLLIFEVCVKGEFVVKQ